MDPETGGFSNRRGAAAVITIRRHAAHGRSRRGGLVAAKQTYQLALNAHTVGWQDANLIGGVGRLECNRSAAAPEALEGGFFVIDQRHHDITRVSCLGFADQRDITIEYARLDHAVAAYLQSEVIA